MPKDRLLDRAQFRTGFEPHVVDEPLTEPAVALEGLGLAATAVQRPHQLTLAALPQRGRRHERLQLGHRLTVVTQGELAFGPVLDGQGAELLEADQLGDGHGIMLETLQCGSAPQPQCGVEQGATGVWVTARPGARQQSLEAGDVGAVRLENQYIAPRTRQQCFCRTS